MKLKHAPILAAATAICLTLSILIQAAFAQLPNTNMGKFVHKPGDNQYERAAQLERHPPPPPPPVFRPSGGGGGGGGYAGFVPRMKPKRPDLSIEPITADEPVPPAGFPPLPDRLELGIAMNNWGGSASGAGASFANTNWGGGGGGGGGAAPGGPPQMTGKSQGYKHYDAGAFIPPDKKRGYYKCKEVSPPHKPISDQIMTGGAPGMPGGGAPPGIGGPPSAAGAIKALGKEPKLNDREDGGEAPEPPAPVVINQSTTQDLSLPEDDFNYSKSNRPSWAGRKMKQIGKRIIMPINSATRRVSGITLF